MKSFSIEAELSVLGTIIVQPSYAFKAVELLEPEDFFKAEHKEFFKFIRGLLAEGYTEAQLNEISYRDELEKRNLLKAVGGAEYVGYMVEFALDNPEKFESACKVIKDKSLLRRIVDVTEEINKKIETTPDPDLLIDELEREVFSLSEARISNTLVPVSEIVPEVVRSLEELASRREMITGIPTGFFEIDNRTSGLHNSDLIIIAARPSMGKTALSLSIAYNVSVREGKNVAFFSLEMSKEQLVMRLLAQESRIPLQKIRTGFLTAQELDSLIKASDTIRHAPLFIDDTPAISILDARAKARRLKSERGLDLLIIDYLQLMKGIKRTENRQQEVSEISRSLKSLAKELDIPVIALSQLSRQVEHRADKRPQLADLRESGCLTGDTLIIDADTGKRIPIKELVGKTVNTLALDENFKVCKFRAVKVFPSGRKKVYLIRTRSGREIKASANHPFLKISGWTRLDNLRVGDRIAVPREYRFNYKARNLLPLEVTLLAHLLGDGCILPRQPYHYTSSDRKNIRFVRAAAYRLFGIKGKIVKQKNWYHLYLPSSYRLTYGKRHPITLWFEKLGLERVRAPEKKLPEALFSCDRRLIRLFLKHIWATDGNISISKGKVSIYYASSSKTLVEQLQHLLLRLGILSKILISHKSGYRPVYQLHVVDKISSIKFLSEVGCFGRRGRVIPEALKLLKDRKFNPNFDTIPSDVWEVYVKPAKERSGLSWRALSKRINTSYCGTTLFKSGLSRERLRRVSRALEDENLYHLSGSDILWDEITEIRELGVEDVYDMTVPEVHNFVANDFIVHNSIEQDSDVVIFIHRPEVYKKEPSPEEQGVAEIIIAKQRNGPTGTVKLSFIKELTRFENLNESFIQTKVEEPEKENYVIEDEPLDDLDDYEFDF